MPLPLRLYNSESRQLEAFQPAQAHNVKLYVCGPTVYNDAHLGHARCYITWDVLFRTLQAFGYGVTYARNITDVDDKIIARALETGSSPQAVATENTLRFREDMARLNTLTPTLEPKATEHVSGMQDMIQRLIEKKHAYALPNNGVYFDTQSMPHYGRLSRKPPEALKAGARVDARQEKRHPSDFALWKCAPETEYGWASPWGYGRPGWHIECSTMIQSVLGEQIDIHAGGADLLFPHHENEIAQSECCSGKRPFVRYWLHNGFVNVDGEKMSKSLGNFSTVRELLEPNNPLGLDANGLRYFLLSHHYRMPVDFTPDALKGAQTRVNKLLQQLGQALGMLASAGHETPPLQAQGSHGLNGLSPTFVDALSADMNTPRALAEWNQGFKALKQAQGEALCTVIHTLVAQAWVLGFDLRPAEAHSQTSPAAAASGTHQVILKSPNATQKAHLLGLLEQRQAAKQAKDFATSDRLRDELQAQGFTITDHAGGWMTLEEL